MPKYIELEKALHVLDNVMSDEGIKHKGKAIRKRLNELPGEDVVEVEHGEWKTTENDTVRGQKFLCSVCKKIAYFPQPTRDKSWVKHCGYTRCPYCGAKMDKKEGAKE